MRTLLSILTLASAFACGGSTAQPEDSGRVNQYQFLVHIVETESDEVVSQPRVTTLEGTTASIESQFCDTELCETARIELVPTDEDGKIRISMELSVVADDGRRVWMSDLLVRSGQTIALETPADIGITYEVRTVRFGDPGNPAGGVDHPRDPEANRLTLREGPAVCDD